MRVLILLGLILSFSTETLASGIDVSDLTAIIKKKEALAKEEADHKLKKLQKSQYSLMFFSSEGCGYCQQFSPILKKFAEDYNISVVSISPIGETNAFFADSKPPTRELIKTYFGYKNPTVPAVFIFKQGNILGKNIPLASQAVSYQDLKKGWDKYTSKEFEIYFQ